MKTIFGVNSATPISKKLKNGYTMYDWVKRQKCFPAFCMRTLCGEDKISAEEIEFLKDKDCKIGLVIRDLTEAEVSGIDGTEVAIKAVETAKELGVPQNEGIALFAEIKPEWSINHNWMISFAQVIFSNGYVPGFIGNTDSSKSFNFDRQASHFADFTKADNYLDTVFMATEPKQVAVPEKWEPYCPSEMEREDMSFWVCGETSFGEIKAEDVYARDEKSLVSLW